VIALAPHAGTFRHDACIFAVDPTHVTTNDAYGCVNLRNRISLTLHNSWIRGKCATLLREESGRLCCGRLLGLASVWCYRLLLLQSVADPGDSANVADIVLWQVKLLPDVTDVGLE
jgi:hypothetical protein